MKKTYILPQTEVVQLKSNLILLAGSVQSTDSNASSSANDEEYDGSGTIF